MKYLHEPTGRTFDNLTDYQIAVKYYAKKYGKGHEELAKKSTPYTSPFQTQYEKKLKEREEAKKKVKSEISKLSKERKTWADKRDSFIRHKLSQLIQDIDDKRLEISKLEIAIKVMTASLKNFEKEERQAYEKANPFPNERHLKNLRNKIYRI